MKKTQRITFIAILITLAIVLHIIEQAIPLPSSIPGIKMGLANIVTIIALFNLSFWGVCGFVVVRVFLTSFLTAGFTAFWFSLAGALLSMVIMYLMIFVLKNIFSLPSISIIGAIAHNIGQLAVASYLVKTQGLMYYLPILIISAVGSGLFVGIISKKLLYFLNSRGYVKYVDELNILIYRK